MKLVYTGREAEFPPKQARKLDARLARISKLLGRGDTEAHVMVTKERFLHQARINVNVWDHHMAAVGADADLFTAVSGAVDNLEKQLAKLRARWRDTKRHKEEPPQKSAAPKAPAKPAKSKTAAPAKRATPKVFRAGQSDTPDHRLKPMTVDEAMLEIDEAEDYLVFEEAGSGRRNVLLRRKDGHFDLIES
jgi:ribosomal subunit interface protein